MTDKSINGFNSVTSNILDQSEERQFSSDWRYNYSFNLEEIIDEQSCEELDEKCEE